MARSRPGLLRARARLGAWVLLAGVLCAATAAPSSARAADWHRVQTAGFEIYTDLPVQRATELGQELERFRSVLGRFTSISPSAQPVPLRVYAFRGRRAFERAVDSRKLDGLYAAGAHQGVATLYLPPVERQDQDGRSTLLHEYVHHFLRENVGFRYPVWFEEGLAEYLSTFVTRGDLAAIGVLPASRAWVLKEFRWLPSRRLIVDGMRYLPDSGERIGVTVRGSERRISDLQMLYAQGWLAVHFLYSDEAHARAIGDFLAQVNAGVAPEDAFPDAFGETFEDFDQELKAYAARDHLALRGVQLTPEEVSPEVKVETMPRLDERFWIAEAALQIPGRPESDLRRDFARALKDLHGRNGAWQARILLDQAELETDLDDPQAALDLLRSNAALLEGSARAGFETARAHLLQASDARDAGPPAANQAPAIIRHCEDDLAAALTRHPDDPALLGAWIDAHIVDDRADAEDALVRLGHLQRIYPQHQATQYDAALLFAEAGRHDRALELLEWEMNFARSDDAAAYQQRLIEAIKAHRRSTRVNGPEPIQPFLP